MILTIDQNYGALEEASKLYARSIYHYVDIAFLGILDFINILEYDVKMENDIRS